MARRRVVSLVASGLLALAAVLAIPGMVAAHNQAVTLACSQGNPVLSINLTNYNNSGGHHNTVSVSIDGSSVLSTTNFFTSYSNTFSAGSSYSSHTAQVLVFAWDDPFGINGWTGIFTRTASACKTATPSPTHTATATATHTATATATHTATATATHTATATATATDPAATETPFQSFQGETATAGSSTTPPPTTTGTDGSSNSSTPLFALLISLAFGGLGLAAVEAQRRSIRR